MGEFVKRARVQKSWTQEQLAGAAQLSVRTVQRAEMTGVMGAETLQALAGALGISIEEVRRGQTDAELNSDAEQVEAFLKNHEIVSLSEIRTGHELGALFRQTIHAHVTDVDSSIAQLPRELFAQLETGLSAWADMWDQIPATNRLQAEAEWTTLLAGLREAGCAVTAGINPEPMSFFAPGLGRKAMLWSVLYVVASPASAPRLVVARRRDAAGS